MSDLVEVVIKWQGIANDVKLAGEFNNWNPEVVDRKEDGSWEKTLKLSPGKYSYKLVVDGEWMVIDDLPSVVDDGGNRNNLLEVVEADHDAGSGGDSDSWEKVSIPEAEDPMTTSATAGTNMQKISVIQRIYSMPLSIDYQKIAAECSAVKISAASTTITYFDSADAFLQRNATFLQCTKEDDLQWKLTTIVGKDKLNYFVEKEEITEYLQELLKTTSSFDEIVSNKLEEVTKKKMSREKWSVGSTEFEVSLQDDKVTSVSISEVGDVSSAMKSIENLARKFKCVPFNARMAAPAFGLPQNCF